MGKEIWRQTLADVMIAQKMATDQADAKKKISANPGIDLAHIDSAVRAGTASLEFSLGLARGSIYYEGLGNIKQLSYITEKNLVAAINAMHLNRREENWYMFLEMVINNTTFRCRATQFIGWNEAKKYLCYINRYLMAADVDVDTLGVEEEFYRWSEETADSYDDCRVIYTKLMKNASSVMFYLIKCRQKLDAELANAKDGKTLQQIREKIEKVECLLGKLNHDENDKSIEAQSRDIVGTELLKLGWMI